MGYIELFFLYLCDLFFLRIKYRNSIPDPKGRHMFKAFDAVAKLPFRRVVAI